MKSCVSNHNPLGREIQNILISLSHTGLICTWSAPPSLLDWVLVLGDRQAILGPPKKTSKILIINLSNLDDHKVVHPPKAWSHPPSDPSGAELQPRSHDGGKLFPVPVFYKLLHLHNTSHDVDSDGDVGIGDDDTTLP